MAWSILVGASRQDHHLMLYQLEHSVPNALQIVQVSNQFDPDPNTSDIRRRILVVGQAVGLFVPSRSISVKGLVIQEYGWDPSNLCAQTEA